VSGSKTIVVRARGTSGQESITLKVNNVAVATWTLTTSMQNYTVTTTGSGGSLVSFTNDSTGRDVQVDYLSVNGSVRQAEAQSSNTAVYQNGACGGGNGLSEWMHCNGAIGFGNL
jgi:endo-1,4-beta-xylanase